MAHTDNKIVEIRDEFGMWGVGVYWTLVEMVAEQMECFFAEKMPVTYEAFNTNGRVAP